MLLKLYKNKNLNDFKIIKIKIEKKMDIIKLLNIRTHDYLDIDSANANESGYTLGVEILRSNKIILETGVNCFAINEGISKLFEITFNIILPQNKFTNFCKDMT